MVNRKQLFLILIGFIIGSTLTMSVKVPLKNKDLEKYITSCKDKKVDTIYLKISGSLDSIKCSAS